MFLWFHAAPKNIVATRQAAAAGQALCLALNSYAAAHGGEYPPTNSIAGGTSKSDALVKGGFLAFYPRNPFGGGGHMRNSAGGVFSRGNFYYERSSSETFKFRLVVFGADEKSGPSRNGVVFQRDFD